MHPSHETVILADNVLICVLFFQVIYSLRRNGRTLYGFDNDGIVKSHNGRRIASRPDLAL